MFQGTVESLRTHQIPDWFHDAKLGIMTTWGLYSVPGWAEVKGDLNEIVAKEGWKAQFFHNPYAEWYLNTMRIEGSPAQAYHRATYGENFSYDDFEPIFNLEIAKWNPAEWADLFARAGARYIVPVSKHCDTFVMWDTKVGTTRKATPYHASRDTMGELAAAARAAGLKFGVYYCAGMDWVYNPHILTDFPDVFGNIPQDAEFVARCKAHWHELIDRYQPSIMWGDIGYPQDDTLPELMAYYYNSVPDGVINDRFAQVMKQDNPVDDNLILSPEPPHFDFRTPEYTSYDQIPANKWECVRGIGHSFGYNQLEGEADYASVEKLVHMLADIVSKNGNLLLGVGPMADGTIPAIQAARLIGLGAWLAVNGNAIYATRPWERAEGMTTGGLGVRFTRKGDAVYAILLGAADGAVTIRDLRAQEGTTIHLLGDDVPLSWVQADDHLTIRLPDGLAPSAARAIAITPAPISTAQ